jgi:DNA polymerase-1
VQADGRIHARFNQTATSTGRIGSEQPNIQNIPVRTADGRELRRAFIAPPGWQLVVADYSQIEMRVLAHLADDPGLVDAFARGADVHAATAARVYGVPESEVTGDQRRFAKVVNYGLAYGMEAYGLAQRAGVETEEARAVLDAYFAGFPRVADYMDSVVQEARDRGYTTTLLGRRRRLPELASPDFRIRQMGERMAKNAPVQGSAADIFKVAMVRLDEELTARALASRMVLTVHDELVLEAPDAEVGAVTELVRRVMEVAGEESVGLKVPLVVDISHGTSWAAAKH